MINIRQEAEEVITGKQPRDNNVLKNAPHPISVIALSEDEWNRCVKDEEEVTTTDNAGLVQSLFASTSRLSTAMASRKEVLAHCFTC
jgi:hypothetical protein